MGYKKKNKIKTGKVSHCYCLSDENLWYTGKRKLLIGIQIAGWISHFVFELFLHCAIGQILCLAVVFLGMLAAKVEYLLCIQLPRVDTRRGMFLAHKHTPDKKPLIIAHKGESLDEQVSLHMVAALVTLSLGKTGVDWVPKTAESWNL